MDYYCTQFSKKKFILHSLIHLRSTGRQRNSFFHNRQMKVELRHLASVYSELDNRNVRPACPKVEATYLHGHVEVKKDELCLGARYSSSFLGWIVWPTKESGRS